MERRIDIKDIKDQLPEFSDRMAVLTLRLQTWVAGCVEILLSRERKMSWFGIEDNEFLLGHGEFENWGQDLKREKRRNLRRRLRNGQRSSLSVVQTGIKDEAKSRRSRLLCRAQVGNASCCHVREDRILLLVMGAVGVIPWSSQRALGAGHRLPRGSAAFAEVTRECWCGKSQAL